MTNTPIYMVDVHIQADPLAIPGFCEYGPEA